MRLVEIYYTMEIKKWVTYLVFIFYTNIYCHNLDFLFNEQLQKYLVYTLNINIHVHRLTLMFRRLDSCVTSRFVF